MLDNGELFFVGLEKSEPRRWVHNTDKQTKILVALAGHFGRNETREKVCAHFDGKMFSLKLDFIYETLPYYGLKYVRIAMNQSSDAMFASAASRSLTSIHLNSIPLQCKALYGIELA